MLKFFILLRNKRITRDDEEKIIYLHYVCTRMYFNEAV